MSKRSEIKVHINALSEIQNILNAMKNLAIIETNKVARYLSTQSDSTLEKVLADFESFYGTNLSDLLPEKKPLSILIGSERGFCGGFNEQLLSCFEEEFQKGKNCGQMVVIGRKLASKIENDPRVVLALNGSDTTEEISSVISTLVKSLTEKGYTYWSLIYHETNGEKPKVIFPFERSPQKQKRKFAFPPQIHFDPKILYPQLLEQYLFSILYRVFYLSFLAENRDRLSHMESALNALEKDSNSLKQKSNQLRQEEITEELEIILLSIEEMSNKN